MSVVAAFIVAGLGIACSAFCLGCYIENRRAYDRLRYLARRVSADLRFLNPGANTTVYDTIADTPLPPFFMLAFGTRNHPSSVAEHKG